MKISIAAIFICCMMAGNNASAKKPFYYDGNRLNEMALADARVSAKTASSADLSESATYMGYIIATADTLANDKSPICIPGTVKVGQLIAVVTKYLQDNPDLWNMKGSTVVFGAFEKAFPCGSEQQKQK